jgi:hypothetical protein
MTFSRVLSTILLSYSPSPGWRVGGGCVSGYHDDKGLLGCEGEMRKRWSWDEADVLAKRCGGWMDAVWGADDLFF